MAKTKARTGNPLLDGDFGSVMDFGKFAEQFRLPGVDSKTLIETQRRNIEAFTKANQVTFEAAQAVVQRQVEILRQTMDETTKAMQELSRPDKPEDIWTKQAELLKEAYEHGLANLRELTELSTRANVEAADLLTQRVTDSLEELRSAVTTINEAAGGATTAKAAQ